MIKRTFIGIITVLFLSLSLSGCVWMLLGVGVAGGVMMSKDNISGELDKDYDVVWSAAEKVSAIMGTVTNKDRTKGIIEADIDKSKVAINIERLTPETLRLKVSARKIRLAPNVALAQKVYVKINQQLE